MCFLTEQKLKIAFLISKTEIIKIVIVTSQYCMF